jgi:pyruvate dehydrogenase E2 component (dihydrolipoamide acetyltransferase)
MPQMGESIAEGTIVRWMKKVGETVDRDEPLFEISTDKVDAEIPSPAAGVLTEIAVSEGQTVPVNSIVATIGTSGDATSGEAVSLPAGGGAGEAPPVTAGTRAAAASTQPQADGAASTASPEVATDVPRQRSSPLVRRIAKEHNVDVSQIHGSGAGGRVTKHDILGYLEGQPAGGQSAAASAGRLKAPTSTRVPPAKKADVVPGTRDEIKPLSIMRKKIAEHMILSRRTSAHVHSVFHVNFSTVDALRRIHKDSYDARGAKLTYMSFIAKAIVDVLQRHPIVNASVDANNIIYKKDINLGIAVALDGGLIVPVIKNADEKNLLGLSRAISDVAERARTKQLKPEEVHDGTFTITNPGQFGAQFGMPIINQPQVAILGIGTIEKRPVVINDAIGIRPMAYLTLGYDHRLIDGATADQFMADVKKTLEEFDAGEM